MIVTKALTQATIRDHASGTTCGSNSVVQSLHINPHSKTLSYTGTDFSSASMEGVGRGCRAKRVRYSGGARTLTARVQAPKFHIFCNTITLKKGKSISSSPHLPSPVKGISALTLWLCFVTNGHQHCGLRPSHLQHIQLWSFNFH